MTRSPRPPGPRAPRWGAAALVALLSSAPVALWTACDGATMTGAVIVDTRMEAGVQFTDLRVALRVEGGEQTFYDATWRVGSPELPKLPARVVVKRAEADRIIVEAEAKAGSFLVDRRSAVLDFTDADSREVVLVLEPTFLCGNGTVDEGEECDCGEGQAAERCGGPNDDRVPDACRRDCRRPSCGDGVVDENEACDDGNDFNRDECTRTCRVNVCGDGVQKDRFACLFETEDRNITSHGADRGVAAGDLDGDGDVDLVMATAGFQSEGTTVLRNDSSQGFVGTRFTSSIPEVRQFGEGLFLRDLDGDERLDVLFVTASPPALVTFLNDGTGGFRSTPDATLPQAVARARGLAVADFDGDGHVDVLLGGYASGALLMSCGLANGSFAPCGEVDVGAEPAKLIVVSRGAEAAADALVVKTYSPEIVYLINDGTGGMQVSLSHTLDAAVLFAVVGDAHPQDGLELIVSTADGRIFLFHEESRGSLGPPEQIMAFPGAARDLVLVDIDDDGWLDLLSVSDDPSGYLARVHLLAAVGDVVGSPAAQLLAVTNSNGTMALPVDLDSDGDDDLLVADADQLRGTVSIFRNDP